MVNQMVQRWKGACLFAAAVLMVWGFVSPCPAMDVRIGTWKTAQTIQPFLYEKFLPAAYPSTVCSFTNPADQKMALLAGSLDMCGSTVAHAIYSASTGQPVVVVAALCNKCSALVVGSTSNIRTVGDLKGRRIGYVPGTMHEILLRDLLTRQGLYPDRDVSLIRIDFFDMGIALSRGSIDAFLSGEPFPALAEHLGYGTILAYPYDSRAMGTINAVMLVTRRSIEQNPGMVYELVLAHAGATRYLSTHRDEWLKRASMFGVSLQVLDRSADNMELAWELDEGYVEHARALGQRMQALHLIDRQPDYGSLFDLTFVKKVKERKEHHVE